MGDSETVVAQTSTVMGYSSSGYTTSEYPAVSSNVTSDGVGSTDTAYPLADGPSLADENVYNTHPTYDAQEPPATSNESNPAVCVANASVNHISQENVVPDSAQVAGFDSSLNGNGVGEMGNLTHTGSGENGSASDDAGRAADQPFEELPALSAEEERLWSILKANSLDFNAWTALIEETEKVAEDNISKIRKVYDTFLAEFPLCYGYWKKYADHEARLGSIDKVVEVYERAVVAVTYSVDIWLHYCMFAISTYEDPDTVRRLSWVHQYTKCCWEDHVQLRAKMASSSAPFQGHSMVVSGRLFDRGLAYVGADYLSYPLWDKYIEYEYSQQQWCRLAMIYTRIFENPNQQLDRYFNSFKELAASRPLSELQSADEATALVTANLEAGAQGVEGEVPSNGVEPSAKAGLTEAEELEKYVAAREDMYKKAKEFDSKIIGFETAIRRPYFHVRPLVDAELENWHGYLDFIEREGDLNKVVKIYERCLIACANYPEYWIRYVLCMEASGSMDLANNALARATQVFVKRQPEIHLFAARFKEQIGDIVGARAAYQLLHSGISPGLLEAVVKHANMEHRLGNLEDAFSLYEQAIATERGKEQSQTLPMLFVQYARFLYLVAANAEKAREVLVEATDNVQLSKPLLEALIHLEAIQSTPKRIDYIDSLVEKFVLPTPDNPNPASITDREELSSIFLEFLDLFGDVEFIKKAEDRHARIFLRHRNTSELRKRHAEDFLASDKAKLARSYAGVPSTTQSVMGAYPAAQNQWAAGYGLQPQAWSQASQAAQAGQQWNPSYGQQAGYGGYAGYGSTYTPQVATSTAQTAAYGTYPPTYPAQAVPQQSYVQPATAATFAPPTQQQAPPVQQAYYGTYY